ncbi:MAG: hypothetical protein ACEY3G_04635 [Arsenophonus sp.]
MMIRIHRQATTTPKISAAIQSAKAYIYLAHPFFYHLSITLWSDQEKL